MRIHRVVMKIGRAPFLAQSSTVCGHYGFPVVSLFWWITLGVDALTTGDCAVFCTPLAVVDILAVSPHTGEAFHQTSFVQPELLPLRMTQDQDTTNNRKDG